MQGSGSLALVYSLPLEIDHHTDPHRGVATDSFFPACSVLIQQCFQSRYLF